MTDKTQNETENATQNETENASENGNGTNIENSSKAEKEPEYITVSEHEAQIKELLTQTALKEARAKSIEIVRSLLDPEKIILKENRLIGLEPQLSELKKKAPYLFENSLADLIGYRPEPSADLLPRISPSDMTYSQAVAYLEHCPD